jgi:outer membrane immunogenic protein
MVFIALATFSATPALAGEPSSFTGPWIGLTGGFDNVRIKAEGESGNKSGVFYGINAGYDYNYGGGVVGVEIEAADATTKESITDGVDTLSLAATRDLYAGVRLGIPVSNSVLLYAKGGYTNARFKLSFNSDSASDNLDGYRVGAGVEYARGHALARLECRYSNYGKYDLLGVDLKMSRNQVVATAGWRF